MKVNNFQDLLVWQKGHQLVLRVYDETKTFPNEENFGLVSQMRRSSVSICANIAEGYKKSTKDFIRFLDISRGSLEEIKYFLILSKDLNYLSYSKYEEYYVLSEELGKMISSIMNKLSSRLRR